MYVISDEINRVASHKKSLLFYIRVNGKKVGKCATLGQYGIKEGDEVDWNVKADVLSVANDVIDEDCAIM